MNDCMLSQPDSIKAVPKGRKLGSLSPIRVTANQPLLVDVLSKKDQRILNLLIGAWLLTVACFTAWWFRPGHVENP